MSHYRQCCAHWNWSAGNGWVKLLRVLVEVNLYKPLIYETMLTLLGSRIFIPFQYERLSRFYYFCGVLLHDQFGCPLKPTSNSPFSYSLLQYGLCMRASSSRLRSNFNSLVGKGSNSFKTLFIQQFPLLFMCLTLFLLTLWIILHLHLCWLMLIPLFLFLIPSIFLYPTPLWCYRKMTTIHSLLWILNGGQDLSFLNLITPLLSLMVAHVRGSLFLLHFLWYQ